MITVLVKGKGKNRNVETELVFTNEIKHTFSDRTIYEVPNFWFEGEEKSAQIFIENATPDQVDIRIYNPANNRGGINLKGTLK